MAKKGITTSGRGAGFRGSVIDKVSTLIISAFGLIAALAWNSAIQGILALFLSTSSKVEGLVIYAVVVTIIAVVVTIYLTQLSKKVGGTG